MKYHNHRQEPYFTFLKNGIKTIEGRVRKGWYCNVQPGDKIEVYNEDETDKIITMVLRVTPYKSIREMLTKEPIKKILPDIETIEQGIQIYRRFYTLDQEKQFGMMAIQVKRIN